MSDRDLKNWDQRLTDQAKRGWDNYLRRRIDLSTARTDGSFAIAGEFIYVEKSSNASASAAIKLNRNTNDSFDLIVGSKIQTIFNEFYITNIAQAGEWIDILIGINFLYDRPYEGMAGLAQETVVIKNAAANVNTPGPNQICIEALIKADVQNTGIAWIEFGAAAVQRNCYCLDPGDTIKVPLSNLNYINANFENAVANPNEERVVVVYTL